MAGNIIQFSHRRYFFGLVVLAIWVLLAISACGARPTQLAPVTLPQEPTIVATPVSLPTATSLPLPSDTPTAAVTSVPSVACFTTYYDPFAFMPGGHQLLVRAEKGVQIFDLDSMQEVKFILSPTNLNGPGVALSPDGAQLAWALEDGTLQVLRIADQSVMATFESGQAMPLKLEFSPAGDQVFSVSDEGSIKAWSLDGTLLDAFLPGFGLVNMGLSPDGSLLATIPADGPVRLWSTPDFKWVQDLGGTGGYDTSDVAFSPDGKYLAADLVTSLFVWSIPDATELMGTITPTNSMAVAYSPDGRYLAYNNLGDLVLSSPDGLRPIKTLTGH
ncbi:MAG TPA: hypothetical protein VF831_09565, partial [Anaerolineales bacterium]